MTHPHHVVLDLAGDLYVRDLPLEHLHINTHGHRVFVGEEAAAEHRQQLAEQEQQRLRAATTATLAVPELLRHPGIVDALRAKEVAEHRLWRARYREGLLLLVAVLGLANDCALSLGLLEVPRGDSALGWLPVAITVGALVAYVQIRHSDERKVAAS